MEEVGCVVWVGAINSFTTVLLFAFLLQYNLVAI